MKNIYYKTNEIKDFFSRERVSWDQFYYSERKMIDLYFRNVKKMPNILDIGCGCGGLGLALDSKYKVNSYTGIEINEEAADYAIENNKNQNIIHGDFLDLFQKNQIKYNYDLVFSLSCFDWQLNFYPMLSNSWQIVNEGGSLIISLRLTEKLSVNDISKSYQYINYAGEEKGEVAPYVVLNANEIISTFIDLGIKDIKGYGFYGNPSKTAVTPFEQVCFTVFLLSKTRSNLENFDVDMPIKTKYF